MNQYEIIVSKSAAKELSKLPKQVNNKIIKAILALSGDPRPNGAKKLRGISENWRIRIGDYRVIYAVADEILVVDIRKVGHRKDIYE
ncbi:addiction module toxin, RelE/StbE family [Belliella baltica DSM 15883]|uniref:Addiction module toxin, RelE/StbE family n=1 Tax=Belliella baltica (strain DSM 15883 / CIP 108006 / LMG 21964 / BA134) TaxID=866536 RepID=I3Z0T9_BELBD|nr:type II toxin-antitoxin system RelE/ParE family toxin [Belliella baltica]AFL82857.1 addiction module toxin, RelE/StbE family [Belliella baltica DSM 15883]